MAYPEIQIIDNANLQKIVDIINGMIAEQEDKTINALSIAKGYTDTKVSEINVSEALKVDEAPIYDASGAKPVIRYKQSGVDKTTDNLKTWFFYYVAAEDKAYQTLFIDGEELTIKVANEINFDDYVKKTDVVSTYTGTELEKDKIPNLSALDDLKNMVNPSLSEQFVSQAIYDALPDTKLTDGIKYYID